MVKEKEDIINPIDPDKVAEKPGLLPYAHHLGSAIIKPIDMGRVKGTAMQAMYGQTEDQLKQIKEQIELLAHQAQRIHDRITVSEKIYDAKMSFKPVINNIYYLYMHPKGHEILSMIAPHEWGKKGAPYEFISAVKLQADHTWDLVQS